jgi:hypothetical protein
VGDVDVRVPATTEPLAVAGDTSALPTSGSGCATLPAGCNVGAAASVRKGCRGQLQAAVSPATSAYLNAPLYRAYLLKETLAKALDYRQTWRAKKALREWLAWAARSRLVPFVKLAKTIRRHFDGILAYVGERLTNGIVEGINTRLRMIARRAFGFHGPEALISMLYLCCGGIELNPRLP